MIGERRRIEDKKIKREKYHKRRITEEKEIEREEREMQDQEPKRGT